MRLFLQREGRVKQAVGFGLMSTVCWAVSLHYQKRGPELKKLLKEESLQKVVQPLLRKAKRSDAAPAIIQILQKSLKGLPNVDMRALVNDVHRALAD